MLLDEDDDGAKAEQHVFVDDVPRIAAVDATAAQDTTCRLPFIMYYRKKMIGNEANEIEILRSTKYWWNLVHGPLLLQ